MRRILLATALATFALVAGTASAGTTQRDGSIEQAVVQRVNEVRAEKGLRPLALSPSLTAAAATHSQNMARLGFFAHESHDGTQFWQRISRFYVSRGFTGWSVGENLVFGTAPMTADDVVQAWLDSPPHRQNLLNPTWREIGVGVVDATGAPGVFGGDDVLLATADFGVRTKPVARHKRP